MNTFKKPRFWKKLKNFKHEEFASPEQPMSGLNMDQEFMLMLQDMRDKAGIPMFVTSGYRTESYNKAIGGSPKSYHIQGMAADISYSNGQELGKLLKAAIEAGFTGIGIYNKHIHVDNRPSGHIVSWVGISK